MDEEFDLIEQFYYEAGNFVLFCTNIKTYQAMTEEKRKKLIEKMTIMVCKAFAPRRNYDISKAEIREFVKVVIEYEVDRMQ
ncbi:hypothetical protein D0469_03505 [Peribacillus saganii]|uniref:Uncharacterized protein n=1 Tax=Peribacillus saganii TaxID=2303992 RepID=A0A372LS46_9BACI|nr:hypothetical protein [Peribacillus saganii]RFU71019.1 hypothetical protein D0469_03505 [Peribacillus saganii]